MANIIFVCHKFFTYKMQEGDNLLDRVNKVKAFVDQIVYLEVPVREGNIIMIFLESLLMSNEYPITALNTMPTKEYITTRLMHKMSKHKENEPQGKDEVMMSCQNNVSDSPSRQGIRMCFYCGKQGHIAHFWYKIKNKERENAKNSKDKDRFIFATQYTVHSRCICKWIMDSEATKYMTSHRVAFDIYEVIIPRNVRLGDDIVAEFIVIEVETRGK